ncbi:hypothetical protein [Haloechinothrix halophila]|uniref:hypothetical protein n=1 Tax=Haloechinothrix halophila TaxID=1069073 RepID=UPI0003F76EA8|nr:hypothetical protein [Haloechinothrix halophila]
MAREQPDTGPHSRFTDDLIGLDPDDPEARAFAAHLDRMERSGPNFTIESSLAGVADFAESTNRMDGVRRHFAWLVVTLILLGVLLGAWETLRLALTWLAG